MYNVVVHNHFTIIYANFNTITHCAITKYEIGTHIQCVVSYFHYKVKRGKVRPEERQEWLYSEGVKFAKRVIEHKKSWRGVENAYLLSYEDLLQNTTVEIARIFQFLGIEKSIDECERLGNLTRVNLKSGEKPREGKHIRTAGKSRAKEELPPDLFRKFSKMQERAAKI